MSLFDPVTRSLLAFAPGLPDLPADQIADELTSIYVEIAAARMLLAGGLSHPPETLTDMLDRMGRMADVLEAKVILGVEPRRIRAAAFAAGSARQVIFQVANLTQTRPVTRVDEDAISAEIAASLLFLVAERTADAFEASRQIVTLDVQHGVRRATAFALRELARGRLVGVARMNGAHFRHKVFGPNAADASDLLYARLIDGMALLARDCLGQVDGQELEEAQQIFSHVRDLAVDVEPSARIADSELFLQAPSAFPGPHHLAGLLDRAANTFRTAAIIRIPPPEGSEAETWGRWLRKEARRWPFIWENHQRAVQTGYLDVGRSQVMTSPTGSGKTTLATLKIAATLTAGKSVVYLAPTHALISQIERDLNERVGDLAPATSIEDALAEEIGQQLPRLAVLTPERCFALLTFAPELFEQAGLLVFDECHLMGAIRLADGRTEELSVDRRGIDAMLCLLSFLSASPNSDFLLLSAMVSNAQELAAWLETTTGRPCGAFEDRWKPTRQLKACVVYDRAVLENIERELAADWRSRSIKPRVAPKAVKSLANAQPYGVFSLSSGWNPDAPDTHTIRSFSEVELPLNVGVWKTGWGLTANRNEIAAALATRLEATGLKVIVFCESIPTTGSVAKRVNMSRAAARGVRSGQQEAWRRQAIEELGAVAALYDAGTLCAAVHHGELLPEERSLAESMFRDRNSGVNVLAATSTLAQGLNLPCDAVILAGTDRADDSDPNEFSRSDLMPHEILNALGRAGRAGLAATGFSIVVPAYPIGCNLDGAETPTNSLFPIIFSEGDQCVELLDPIAALFDEIAVEGVVRSEASYLLRRLAIGFGAEREGVETFESLSRRSFGYFQMASQDAAAAELWLQNRRGRLEQLIEIAREEPARDWFAEIAAKSGARPEFIAFLVEQFAGAPVASTRASDWMAWAIGLLRPEDDDFDTFIRPDLVKRIFGRGLTSASEGRERRERARDAVQILLEPWFQAMTLVQIEESITEFIRQNEGDVKRPTVLDPMAKRARRFSLRLAPDLGYLCGVFAQIGRKLAEDNDEEPLPLLQMLPQLVRHGFETPYHLYLARTIPGESRTAIQARFEALSRHIEPQPSDDWAEVSAKVGRAVTVGLFDDLDLDAIERLGSPPLLGLPPPDADSDEDQ